MLTAISGIWKIIRGWLDPVVASKVHFTKNVEELEQFIDKRHIIKELGGDDPWTYHYVEPNPGENKLLSDLTTRQRLLDERAAIIEEFEKTIQQWIKNQTAQAVLLQKKTDLIERLRVGYWQLDPYLRAKTCYDRTGMLREGGEVHYYDTLQNDALSKTFPTSTQRPAKTRADDPS